LRAQIEKQSGKRLGKIGADARADTNAAVVETLAGSQADLGVAAPVAGKPVAPESLSAGQLIVVKNFKQPVVFRRHDGRNAEIEAGPLRMRIPLSDVLAIAGDVQAAKSGADAAGRRSGVTVHSQPSDEPVGDEINVIGCTVEEATNRVDKFIDEAALAGKPWARCGGGLAYSCPRTR
jgi:dsDNA-specific endonuclease/ATPase MutS2